MWLTWCYSSYVQFYPFRSLICLHTLEKPVQCDLHNYVFALRRFCLCTCLFVLMPRSGGACLDILIFRTVQWPSVVKGMFSRNSALAVILFHTVSPASFSSMWPDP